jgi:hypothetical protein
MRVRRPWRMPWVGVDRVVPTKRARRGRGVDGENSGAVVADIATAAAVDAASVAMVAVVDHSSCLVVVKRPCS